MVDFVLRSAGPDAGVQDRLEAWFGPAYGGPSVARYELGTTVAYTWHDPARSHHTVVDRGPDSLTLLCGTATYLGRSGEDALTLVHDHHHEGRLDRAALRGGFCLAFVTPEAIELITDAAGMFSVFVDRNAGVASTSLQAALLASGTKRHIDVDAMCELLLCGSTTGEDTCFREIRRIDDASRVALGNTHLTCRRAQVGAVGADRAPSSFDHCVALQVDALRDVFANIAGLACGGGASLGLSGGYDSRLMLLLAREAGLAVRPFTFASAGHVAESGHARRIADEAGVELRLVPVRRYPDLSPPKLEENIADSLVYFDGRGNATMGTFHDVHTMRIHRACMGNASVNLNGLGGELYRNRERLPRGRFGFEDWLECYVAGGLWRQAFVSRAARQRMSDYLATKWGTMLGGGRLAWIDREVARRWYKDIWLPFFAGPRLAAENRIGPAVMPFADARTAATAMLATPFIGAHGELEAAMIRRLDRRVAELPSSYGPGFGSPSLRRRARDGVAAFVPLRARLLRNRLRRLRRRPVEHVPARFAGPIRLLERMALPLSIPELLANPGSRDRTLYTAEFLFRFRHVLDIES